MIEADEHDLAQRLRALRAEPPANDFEARLLRTLSAHGPADNVRVGLAPRVRRLALPAAAATLLTAMSAAALIGHFTQPRPAPTLDVRGQAPKREHRRPIATTTTPTAAPSAAPQVPEQPVQPPVGAKPPLESPKPRPAERAQPPRRAPQRSVREAGPRRAAVGVAAPGVPESRAVAGDQSSTAAAGPSQPSAALRALVSERVAVPVPGAPEQSRPQSDAAGARTLQLEATRRERAERPTALQSPATRYEIRREREATAGAARADQPRRVGDLAREREQSREREQARERDLAREREQSRERERTRERSEEKAEQREDRSHRD